MPLSHLAGASHWPLLPNLAFGGEAERQTMGAVHNVVDILIDPWIFTQSHPLSTADLIAEAKRRGLDLDAATLREFLPPWGSGAAGGNHHSPR
jgi:hypothetical protein